MPTIGTGISIGGGVSISTQLLPSIGDAYGGGFYAGQISTSGNGVATHNLVVGPKASTNYNIRWTQNLTVIANVSSNIDGPTNTTNIANTASYGAAYAIELLTVGGYTDWYLPAKNELEICYYNLKPTATPNLVYFGGGVNPNAVPSRASTTYTSGIPAQTSATQFQYPSGSEFFNPFGNGYWASTQGPSSPSLYAWRQLFNAGYQGASGTGVLKTTYCYARAVRRVAV